MPRRARRLRRWIIGGIAVIVVLAVGGPFVYINFIEGPAPAKLTCERARRGRHDRRYIAGGAPPCRRWRASGRWGWGL